MKKTIVFTFITLVLILTGCRNNSEALPNNTDNPYMRVKNSTIENDSREEKNVKISQHIANLAASVPNVNNATAVVLGNYAVVGIDVDKNLDRSDVGTIKYAVAESLKSDPHGAKAIVIADPDLYARLQGVVSDIKDGKPIRGIMNELSAIIGRVMPEIPADLTDPTPKNSPEKPKKEMNQQDAEKLDNQQNKQSKHQKQKHDN